MLPLVPVFEVYKDYDYWPLECMASRLFRHSANVTQSKKRAQLKATVASAKLYYLCRFGQAVLLLRRISVPPQSYIVARFTV